MQIIALQKREIDERQRRRAALMAKVAAGNSASRDPSVARSTPPQPSPAHHQPAAEVTTVVADHGAATNAPVAAPAEQEEKHSAGCAKPDSHPEASAPLEHLAAAVRAAKAGASADAAGAQGHDQAQAVKHSASGSQAPEQSAQAPSQDAESDVEAVRIDSDDEAVERIDTMFRPPTDQVCKRLCASKSVTARCRLHRRHRVCCGAACPKICRVIWWVPASRFVYMSDAAAVSMQIVHSAQDACT